MTYLYEFSMILDVIKEIKGKYSLKPIQYHTSLNGVLLSLSTFEFFILILPHKCHVPKARTKWMHFHLPFPQSHMKGGIEHDF